MEPVRWAGRSGDEVETVIAVMLSRRFPRAERIRASRGDGGIDVQVPDADGWNIFQIKNYTTRFHKDKVQNSFERLKTYAAEEGLTIKSWNLLMPMDPSKEARKWLTALTADTDFPCGWPGAIYVSNLAAEFRDVVDYYWGDGKRELAELIAKVADIRNVVQRGRDATAATPLEPTAVSGTVRDIFDLVNKYDPHFQYTFSVDIGMPPIISRPGLIFQHTTGIDGVFVTYNVFPRYAAALIDRPINISLANAPQPGSPDSEAFQRFLDYGAPFESTEATVTMLVDAPGGLAGTLPLGRIKVGPTAEEESIPDKRWRLQVVSPSGQQLADTEILTRPPTTGVRGRGYRMTGRARGESFTFEHLHDVELNTWVLTLKPQDISGKLPSDVLPGLKVMTEFHEPNRWRVAELRGPVRDEGEPITASATLEGMPELAEFVRAIDHIQEYTTEQLYIPNIDELTDDAAREIVAVSHLMRGSQEVRELAVHRGLFDPRCAAMSSGGPQNVTWTCPLSVRVGSLKIELGTQRRYAHNVDIELTELSEDEVGYVMRPHEGDKFVMIRHTEEARDA